MSDGEDKVMDDEMENEETDEKDDVEKKSSEISSENEEFESDLDEVEDSGQEEEQDEVSTKVPKKRRKLTKNDFIDDEAELSGDDEVSDDEHDDSDDDADDLDLVDKDAPELDSDEEEAVRELYHKQLESEDKRAVLLLQEQFEDKDVAIGQRRRRKFRWQTKELMDKALGRHYDPDEDDSDDYDDDEEDEYDETGPRLRRPNAEAILIGSTKITSAYYDEDSSNYPVPSTSRSRINEPNVATCLYSDDESNSNAPIHKLPLASKNTGPSDLNRFVFRDKELVQALSTKETVIITREEKNQLVQREIKKVLQSKSIFDQLYS